MATKAVQSWRIEQDNVAEKWTLVINNPSTGKFKVSLKSPKQTTSWLSDEITSNGDAGHMRLKLLGFFNHRDRTHCDIHVTLVMHDTNSAETAVAANAVKHTYTI